uniref:DUF2059 domain-containing protein n=1 Tax=Strongyloides stercoralis TaxID=6248 RepID=A0A0K0DU16_STRER
MEMRVILRCQSAMDGAKNVMNMVPESYMNDLSNITNGISSEDVNEAVNSIYPIVANVISQKGKLNYQAIASKWISVNPKLSDKIIMIMEFIANKTKSLPQVDQDFLAKWSQYNQDVLDKLSKGEINEEELNDIYKKSLEDLIAIPENDRKEFDTVVPGLGTLLVDSEFVDKINAAISNITEESMREINKYIFSKIINLTITTPTPSPLN